MVEEEAFNECAALEYVECGKLKIIKEGAFRICKSLRSINLPSAEIVAKFGNKLERFDREAFWDCRALERITIPLKDDIIHANDTFMECYNLQYVDLVESAHLHQIISVLHLKEWRDDMNKNIDSINQILSTTYSGGWDKEISDYSSGEKAWEMRIWIRSLIGKIMHYQVEHQRIMNKAATTLQLALPRDIVMNNVLDFLDLPHWFGEEDESEEEEDDSDDGSDEEEEYDSYDESEEEEEYDSYDESEEEVEDDRDDDEEMSSV